MAMISLVLYYVAIYAKSMVILLMISPVYNISGPIGHKMLYTPHVHPNHIFEFSFLCALSL